MKVGNLRLNQKYRFLSLESSDVPATCDNCGAVIKNIYTIQGEDDKADYIVGSECVIAYTCLNPNDIKEAKRKFAKKQKFIRELKKSGLVLIDIKHNMFWFYEQPKNTESVRWQELLQGQWQRFWRGRGIYSLYKNNIDKHALVIYKKEKSI